MSKITLGDNGLRCQTIPIKFQQSNMEIWGYETKGGIEIYAYSEAIPPQTIFTIPLSTIRAYIRHLDKAKP